jgi:hypothetical protein
MADDVLPTPVELWRSGAVSCVVIHNQSMESYEIRVLEGGRVIERRWFISSEEAMAFASAARVKRDPR